MVPKDFYKKLFEYKILTTKELDKLLELFGIDAKKRCKIKRKIVKDNLLKRVKIFGEWVYIVNTKKLQKLFKEK